MLAICFHGRASSLGSFGNFRLLRVLDVVDAILVYVSLPPEVFELFHLRYLAFCCPRKIPAAISNLRNFQTLIIHPRQKSRNYLPRYLCLPLEIWRMPQLRHLVLSYFVLLPHPEGETFVLENLQTLSVTRNFICTQRVMKMIPNLKKLEITYFGDDKDYQLDNLVHLHQLEKLKLEIYTSSVWGKGCPALFPTMLKKLSLSGGGLPWKDMTIVGSLPNLQVLKLRDGACIGDKWETTEGEFPQLKFLLIEGSDPSRWITESSHFPSLKCLLLHRCWHLSEIPDGIGEIPTLELIEVKRGSTSLVEWAKRIQEEQQNYLLLIRYSAAGTSLFCWLTIFCLSFQRL
ncbi:hypothetical protein Pfo_015762 [Paulownia fortunei]|nr:hypothetical protein Pfo_015762 [Paulownia fortunei]